MPVCVYCGVTLKTCGTLARHHRLVHDGRSLNDNHVPEKVVLTFFVNQLTQTLSCPLSFCSYESKRCRTVKPVAKHFAKCHPYHQLCVRFHCQRCNAYIDPAEMHEHVQSHLEQDLYHRPFSPPTPNINPTDNSLNFVRTCNSPEYAAVHQCQDDVRTLVKDTQLTSSTFHSDLSSPDSQDPQLIPDTCDTTKSSPTLASTPLSVLIPSRPPPELLDPSQRQVSESDSLESPDSCNALANLPPCSNHPSESSSASPIVPISPRMPDILNLRRVNLIVRHLVIPFSPIPMFPLLKGPPPSNHPHPYPCHRVILHPNSVNYSVINYNQS